MILREYEVQVDREDATVRRAAANLVTPTVELLLAHELPADLTLACTPRETGVRDGLRHPRAGRTPEFTAMQTDDDEYTISAALPFDVSRMGAGINVVKYCLTLPPNGRFGGVIAIDSPVKRIFELTPMDPRRQDMKQRLSASAAVNGLALSLNALQAGKGINGFRTNFEPNLLHRGPSIVPMPRSRTN
ncbi:MAG TPA: hypothetical protein VF733_06575 [Candidatus Saccharimonadales bacterium]